MNFTVEKSFYSLEALNMTVYHFSGDYDITVSSSPDSDGQYMLSIERKDKTTLDDSFRTLFLRELTDQQLRLDIESRFGYIRNLIVEEAFKPVTK